MPHLQSLRPIIPKSVWRKFAARSLSVDAARAANASFQEAAQSTPPDVQDIDPNTVLPEFETALMKNGVMPIGSRRRRLALRTTGNLPFEQLPYQAFQEARKILSADREEKLAQIQEALEKISWLEKKETCDIKGGQLLKNLKLARVRRQVERLKILADVNDPLVKKNFEDGLGDMNKPIYRYYAERRWRAYDYRLMMQRITQFNVVPDFLPKLEPLADVQLFFRQHKIVPGQIVDSAASENSPRLRVQVFDKGERLVTIVVVDSDVPDVENDGFTKRCHFLSVNIPLSPTIQSLPLSRIKAEDQLVVPWLPAFSQKGAPYHRLGIFLFEQPAGKKLDSSKLKELYSGRDNFSLKSLRDKFSLKPFGFNIFRSVWDANTASVMARHNIPGANIELRPARVYSVKPGLRPRGWEAKRQGPKYRHLWKYTKRIRGLSNSRRWAKRR